MAAQLCCGLPTNCNGLTKHVTTTPIIVGERWSEAKCETEERTAVVAVHLRVASCVKRPPSQMVFEMAISLVWNLGPAATCGSGALATWNRGQWTLGCQPIARGDDGTLVWSYICKTVRGERQCTFVLGLANRCADEAQTCGEVL